MGLLRFILAITVVLTHSTGILGLKFVGGHIAVQAFYIISGFYMTLILNEKYIGQNSSYKLFITNRLLRLFPIYWCILGLTLMLGMAISIHSHGNNVGPFKQYTMYGNQMSISTWIFLIFSNIFLFFQDVVMFLGLDTSTGIAINPVPITPTANNR
jgi:peptidoglycan/LPS O-acetylase OafA/YrhL